VSKLIRYAVRSFFEKLNKYNFELKLVEELLNHDTQLAGEFNQWKKMN